MMPQTLAHDRLYAFVFGPGQGECTVLWVPPGIWIVIDSCKVGNQAAALHVLAKYPGDCGCLMLTHRHHDHYGEMPAVMSFGDWDVLACNDLMVEHDDDPEAGKKGDLEETLSRLRARNRNQVDRFWWTWRADEKQFGEATLTILHPEELVSRAKQNRKNNELNEISSAMLVQWHGVTLLLGADTPNPYWRQIATAFQSKFDLGDHTFSKIPHHGSGGSLDRSFLIGPSQRTWVATPYNSGRKKLPSFVDGEGVDQMLKYHTEIHLTGLPVSHAKQSESPCVATRQQIRDGLGPTPDVFQLPRYSGLDLTQNPANPSCYVITSFTQSGSAQIEGYGPGSVRVTDENARLNRATSYKLQVQHEDPRHLHQRLSFAC